MSRVGGVLGVDAGLGDGVVEVDGWMCGGGIRCGVYWGCGRGFGDGCGMGMGILGYFWDSAGCCAVADCGVGRDGVALAVVLWLWAVLMMVWLWRVMLCLTDAWMAVLYVVAVWLVGARLRRCAVCECGVWCGGGILMGRGFGVVDGMG